ncbi:MAG: DUF429 domain-containing protein [Actinomycetes bacterium]
MRILARGARVLGVDGCPGGWAGITWGGSDVEGWYASTLRELIALASAAGPLAVVGVDMPIGLADVGRREADRLAQSSLGRRSASIFVTPTRRALAAADRAAASRLNVELGGPGVTAQAYALRAKVLEVDDLARELSSAPAQSEDTLIRLVEVHPEMSFATMAGDPLRDSKRTWSGARERRRLLAEAGLDLDVDLGIVGAKANADDVVDAAAAAWSAFRVANGDAVSRPDPPEFFSDGLSAAIWS